MSVGELIAFTQYVGGMIWPMEMLGWLTNGLSSAKASVKRLNKIYAEMPEITDSTEVAADEELNSALFSAFDINGDISFEHVTYKAGEKAILDDVSFDIKAGQTLGIMGSTGSGKTTIINLLKRMYDVKKRFPMSFPLGLEHFEDGAPHFVDHLRQRLGGVDVYDESVTVVFYFRLFKAMAYQVCFAITTG